MLHTWRASPSWRCRRRFQFSIWDAHPPPRHHSGAPRRLSILYLRCSCIVSLSIISTVIFSFNSLFEILEEVVTGSPTTLTSFQFSIWDAQKTRRATATLLSSFNSLFEMPPKNSHAHKSYEKLSILYLRCRRRRRMDRFCYT